MQILVQVHKIGLANNLLVIDQGKLEVLFVRGQRDNLEEKIDHGIHGVIVLHSTAVRRTEYLEIGPSILIEFDVEILAEADVAPLDLDVLELLGQVVVPVYQEINLILKCRDDHDP